MPPYRSAPDDLVLHGPRVLGLASPARIAGRFGLDPGLVHELLLDHEARGWVARAAFAGSDGWYVTEQGRPENERRLAVELDRVGARDAVTVAHAEFLPANRRFGKACTDWQIRPTRTDAMAANGHDDWRWDDRVLRTLGSLGSIFRRVSAPLAERLERFGGYAERYEAALARVDAGDRRWVDAPDLDSCHTVWIQLHEDLLATLGIQRGSDA